MLSDFEAQEMNRAKKILENDLFLAKQIHQEQKEKQKNALQKPSLWSKVKSFFSDLF